MRAPVFFETPCSVVGGILFVSCSSVCVAVHSYVEKHCKHHVLKSVQCILTKLMNNDVLWETDLRFRLWGQKVKVGGHSEITCWKRHFTDYRCRHIVLELDISHGVTLSSSYNTRVTGHLLLWTCLTVLT